MSTLYTPTILNSELNYLMILVNLILLSKICYYMSAYNILPINIYDSNWQFCYRKLIVKRAFSVMTPKLLFKIVFAPPLISPLIVRPVIINLHVWLFKLNSWYVLVLLYGLPDITFNKSLDVMLYLDNKSPIKKITSISTNTQLTLLNYRQRYCVIYICNNEVLCIFLEHKLIMDSVRLKMCEEYLNGHQGVHMSQYSVLIVFQFNPFVYYYILSHSRPITTSIYAAVDYGLDLTHIHSLTTNVKLLFCSVALLVILQSMIYFTIR